MFATQLQALAADADTPMDTQKQLPELNESRYCTEVLQLSIDKPELDLDCELLARAHTVGIQATLPSLGKKRERIRSIATSESTTSTFPERSSSLAASDGTASTCLSPGSSIIGTPSSTTDPDLAANTGSASVIKEAKSPSFASYDKYLAGLVRVARDAIGDASNRKSTNAADGGVFSAIGASKSLSAIKHRIRLRKKTPHSSESADPCQSGGLDLKKSTPLLQPPPCGHARCAECVRPLVDEASADPSKVPPSRCCPKPSSVLQAVVEPMMQDDFLRAVVEFAAPGESGLLCSNLSCAEFIPHRTHVNPNRPLAATCRKCLTLVCTICKHDAHPIGAGCPEDLEVESGSKDGDRPAVRRCYRCRTLVARPRGSASLTCDDCEAQFCSMCGGVWDSTGNGCPNICCSDEVADVHGDDGGQSAEEREQAESRTAQHAALQGLRREQEREMQRFLAFKDQTKHAMHGRHLESENTRRTKRAAQDAATEERHAAATTQLEDRQVAEEMELRACLEQSARTLTFRIKHMEAYCEGLGRNTIADADADVDVAVGADARNHALLPPRVVTEQNLRDLGRQYNLRDSLETRHQAKINMMRDRQAHAMDELLECQADELQALAGQQGRERDELEAEFTREEAVIDGVFEERRTRLVARWSLAIEVLCKELEQCDGLRVGFREHD
ncbi:hypothetical protein RJ55_06069 [Drechmeria coniospora]|nr:hypothetical protein RJ55_06069 [Drechmeria coniospora]